jgi:hypothetical protein
MNESSSTRYLSLPGDRLAYDVGLAAARQPPNVRLIWPEAKTDVRAQTLDAERARLVCRSLLPEGRLLLCRQASLGVG